MEMYLGDREQQSSARFTCRKGLIIRANLINSAAYTMNIGEDFVSRNWLILTRLSKMGFEPEEAKTIVKAIEDHKITFREVEKSGRKVLDKIIRTE
jgi:hypothetical protein